MEAIKTVLQTAVLLGLAAALAPASPKIRRAVLFAFAILFVSVLLTAGRAEGLLEFLTPDFSTEAEPPSADAFNEAYRAAVEEGILLDLCQRFDLSKERATVSVTLERENSEVLLSSLAVRLDGVNVTKDVTGLVRYAEATYGVKCQVVLE
ncbi:MAG: hypothetical protein IJY71_02210 [Clostridia bacterium]|nr:hypothetical protein [Clostridia bacterium]